MVDYGEALKLASLRLRNIDWFCLAAPSFLTVSVLSTSISTLCICIHLLSVLIVFFIAHRQPLNKVNAALDNQTSILKFEQV